MPRVGGIIGASTATLLLGATVRDVSLHPYTGWLRLLHPFLPGPRILLLLYALCFAFCWSHLLDISWSSLHWHLILFIPNLQGRENILLPTYSVLEMPFPTWSNWHVYKYKYANLLIIGQQSKVMTSYNIRKNCQRIALKATCLPGCLVAQSLSIWFRLRS